MSFAIAVRIAASSVRSIAGRGQAACGGRRPTSIASVAEPPLPSASALPARVEHAAQRRRGGDQLLARCRSASARAARRSPRAFISTERRTSSTHGLEIILAARPGTDTGSSRRRRRGCAARPGREQAAVIEEHVHELPQHVVQRLDQLLARCPGRRSAARTPTQRPIRAKRDRQASARARDARRAAARARPRRRRMRSRCHPAARSARPAGELAALARPARSRAALACRRSPGARTRRRRGGHPSARPASNRTRSAGRRVRTAPPSGGRGARAARPRASKNLRLASLRSREQRPRDARETRRRAVTSGSVRLASRRRRDQPLAPRLDPIAGAGADARSSRRSGLT